jgi:hypothetical protein
MMSPANSSDQTSKYRATRQPEMTILSDHPILRDSKEEHKDSAREDDAFELESRLGAVYDIIRHRNTRAPLAVGIFGDWGTGKSSAMRWLSDRLKMWSETGVDRGGHCSCRTVWFEPWKYQSRDDVWRGLISEVIISSIDPAQASIAAVVNATKKFGGFLGRSFIQVVSSIKLKAGAGSGKVIPGGNVEAEINLDALTKIAEDYKLTAHPEKPYLNEFESVLKAWVKDSLGENERMVLFIDDLDRCLPAVVLEVLEALKLYLNIPQLVFVIGLDRDVVKTVIRKHYKDAGLGENKADSYLDKMFQVEVEVSPSEGQIESYFNQQVERLDKTTGNYWSDRLNAGGKDWKKIIESTIKEVALHNPRELKRLLNSTLMRGTAAARRPKTNPEEVKSLFGQGCQAYLITRILRDNTLCPASLLRTKEMWEFLAAWSNFIQDYPDYEPVDRMTEKLTDSMNESHLSMGFDGKFVRTLPSNLNVEYSDTYEDLKSVYEILPKARDRKPYPLLDEPLLWKVLAIDCSAVVGLAMSSDDFTDALTARIDAIDKFMKLNDHPPSSGGSGERGI